MTHVTKLATEAMFDMSESVKRFAEILSSIFKPVLEQLEAINVSEKIENTKVAIEQVKRILLEFGYPLHPSIGFSEIHRIVEFYSVHERDKTEKYIRRLILKSFSDEAIDKIIMRWATITEVQNRLPILREGIQCHLEGKYYASISTLLPQLEGLIVQKFNHHDHLNQRQLRRYVELLLDETGTFSFDDAIKMFYINILLDGFNHGCIINSPLSRHAILHGADTNFGFKVNSLRCIIIMDYLLLKFELSKTETKIVRTDMNGN